MISVFLNLLRLVLWFNVVCPGKCSMFTWKECIFCCFGLKSSTNVNEIYLVYHSRLVSPCWFLLSGWSVHWYQWIVKVSYHDCITANLFFWLSVFDLHVKCSYIRCSSVYKGYILFLDWSLYQHLMSFLVSCYSLGFQVHFVWLRFATPVFCIFLIVICMKYLFLSH